MKLKITFIAALLITNLGFSQTKVGTVDTDFIMGKMPEMKEVLTRINSYGKQLDSSFQIKAKAYGDKIEAFKKVEKTISEDDRKTKINEIAVIEQEMAKLRKNGATLIQLRRDEYMKTVVKKGASIGANATIVCGNNIGKYSFIGAGAVVTKEVPDFALMVGNPAKQIGWMSEYGERLDFNSEGKVKCNHSGKIYQLMNNQVTVHNE